MGGADSKRKILEQRFPFSTCNNPHLFETRALIQHGINLTIQFGLIDFHNFKETICEEGINIHSTKNHCSDQPRIIDDDDDNYNYNNNNNNNNNNNSDEEDEDSLMEFGHVPPSPILVPLDTPKSSFKRGSFSRRGSYEADFRDISMVMCYQKIDGWIKEFFPPDSVGNQLLYANIKNYIINSIIQKEDNIDIFLGRVVNHRYKNELSDIIKAIFIEKYEEIKLENLIDHFHLFLNHRLAGCSYQKLENPKFYDKYYTIWKLDSRDYIHYDEEYFFDYFNNGGKSATTMEHIILQNGFLANYRRFVASFASDAKNYNNDTDVEDEDVEDEDLQDREDNRNNAIDFNVSEGNVSTNGLYATVAIANDPIHLADNDAQSIANSFLLVDASMHQPKKLRFSDDDNVININRYLPVDHVLYKQMNEKLL